MKRLKQILGGTLIFFGVCYVFSEISLIPSVLFSADSAGRRLSGLTSCLLFALFGAALFYLGCRLVFPGKPTGKTAAPSAAKQPTPRKTRKELREEKERRKQLQAAWEEEQLKRQNARMEFLRPWKDIDPATAEHIPQWEAALEGSCAMSRYYITRGLDDEYLDGSRDDTGIGWFFLHCDSDLKQTIELYAQIDTYRKACEAHGLNTAHTENHVLRELMGRRFDRRFLILGSEEQFPTLGENTEACLALCRKHDLHLVRSEANYRYYDHVNDTTYEVYVGATFPGSADDAATYGALCLRAVSPADSQAAK